MAVTEVVVGFDGSPDSDEALAWALREGRLRKLPVRAINVWHPDGTPIEVDRLAALYSVAELRSRLLQDVTSSVRTVVDRVHATDVAVTSQVLYGHPVPELIREAGADSLLVVGSRGRGSVTGSMLGSVSQSCVQYAHGTVVVVRGRRRQSAAGRVVVGVDGSASSVQALRFAEQAAAARAASLQVVHAWIVPYLGFAGRSGALPQEALDDVAVQAGETLRESMRRASVDATRRNVEMWLAEGAPNVMLLQAASNADLLVVGSRGYGGWKGLLLGSVSTQSITQSPCPVAVVRDRDTTVIAR
ncbi:universal stress protein [Jidongwangia harbinensis]|uniref:universal stress protein n=1 Tax=Jidongwangia harbinensis TaxID=2878561 RepID=UPI001CDA507B|nr:universal stress protein [Jidongwangia harbinensis]MCA2218900.1 universal stress protein [Jidongwangia harbinensis]